MSKISAGLKKKIKEIKRLADGSIDDQLKACTEYLQKLLNCGQPKTEIDKSVIQELLPTIIKLMESNDHVLKKEGVKYVVCITNTPDKQTNRKILIDAGLVPKLVNLLTSTDTDVLIMIMKAITKIADDFPEKFLENGILEPIIQCLKSDDELVAYYSTRFILHISYESEEHIAAIFEADGVEPLIKILESKNDGAIKRALFTLFNITSCNAEFCQRVLNLGALKSMKILCDRLFADKKPKRSNVEVDESEIKQEKTLKVLVIAILKIVTSYGQVDLIINDNFIPIVLQHIKDGKNPETKTAAVKVIVNVISYKRDFIPALIQDHNIFSFCYSNLGSSNINLLITCLTAICNIVAQLFEDKENIRQKIRDCGDPTKLTNLCKHSNEEIRQLSTMLYEFVFVAKSVPFVEVSARSNEQEPELIELDDTEDDDTPAVETPQIGQQRKRLGTTHVVGRLRRSKKLRVSLEQIESSDDEDGNDQYNDFDDHPINSSLPGAAPTESNPNDFSGQQSFVGHDTVAVVDGPSRLHPKTEPTPQDFDIPATSASHQLPVFSVAASTMNETDQNEMKPSISALFGNPSRFLSYNSLDVPESVSTNDENIRHDHSGRQSFVGDDTVAADGSSRFYPKEERPPTPQTVDIPTTSASRRLPDLPVAASTNNENIRNNNVGRQIVVKSETAATADESVRNCVNPGKQSPIDADFVNPLSRFTTSATYPALPVAAASENNGTIPIESNFQNIEYWRPYEKTIYQFCETLEIQFNRKQYSEFMSKIEINQITSNLKPANVFQPIDQSGFGCLSILLTGNEDASSAIRMKINQKFVDCLVTFDKEKIKDVTCLPFMLAEHLETIATWLKCRILLYCNGWKKYGSWNEGNPVIPLFVLNKKENGYQIVLDLKNNNV